GIRSRRLSQLRIWPTFTTQGLILQGLAILALLAVVLGCLGLFGIDFSTVSAHPFGQPNNHFPFLIGTGRLQRRGRRNSHSPGEALNSNVNCGSYSRYSSDAQREASIPDQQRKCREFPSSLGASILPKLEFADQAVSGTQLHRQGLDAMLTAAGAGRFQVLFFHNLSRLARESVISMPLLKQLAYVHRVRIISVTEGIDSARDGWDTMAAI